MNQSLYLYWPFYPSVTHTLCSRYAQAIEREVQAAISMMGNQSVVAVYLKINDPKILLQGLLDKAGTLNNRFPCTERTEITLEVDSLASVGTAHFVAARALGINRLCINMSLTHYSLSLFDETRALINQAKEWIENISLDIHVRYSSHLQALVRHIVSWPITHISLQMASIPDAAFIPCYADVFSQLERNGYTCYEFMHFSKEGYESQYQKTRWNRMPCKGFGAGAWSFDGYIRSRNHPNIMSYMCGINKNKKGAYFSERLTKDEIAFEMLINRLRTKQGMCLQTYFSVLGKKEQELFVLQKNGLIKEGYLVETNGYLALTMKGFFVENQVLLRLIN